MSVQINDKYIFHSENGMDYRINVININEFRESSMKYGLDVYDGNGIYAGDVMFVGDDFFEQNEHNIEKIV